MFGECVPKLGDVVFYLHISSSYNMLEAAVGSYIGLRSTIFLEAPILASKCWFVARKWKGRRDPTNLACFPWHGGFSFWSCLGHSLRSQLGPWSNLQNGWAALGVVLYFWKSTNWGQSTVLGPLPRSCSLWHWVKFRLFHRCLWKRWCISYWRAIPLGTWY